MDQTQKRVLWLSAAFMFTMWSFFMLQHAGKLWDTQVKDGIATIDHAAQTANIHGGQGLLGFGFLVVGLVLMGTAIWAGSKAFPTRNEA